MRQRSAKIVVKLRFVLVPLWIAGALLAYLYLPSFGQATGGAINAQLLPQDSEPVRAEALSKLNFPFPLVTRTLVVRHDEDGLPPEALREAAETARDVREGRVSGLDGLAAVAPVPNVLFEPESQPTTILYYLYFRPEVSLYEARNLAQSFAEQQIIPREGGEEAFVGETGTEPATVVRESTILDRLPWVTLATAALVAIAVAVHFRSLVAPFVNLLTVGISYVAVTRALGWLSQTFDFAAPSEVEPVVVVLLFGIVTDYGIFFLSGFQERLREGLSGREAAEQGTAGVIGIVLTAGLVVALATGSLIFAGLSFFRLFGPTLAVSVLVGALVTVTFVPGVLAICGRFALWPGAPSEREREGDREGIGEDNSMRARIAGLAVHRPLATAVVCILLLGAASIGLLRYELGNPIIDSLPVDSDPRRAHAAALAGFPADGVVAPTVAVVQEPGLADNSDNLQELGGLLADRPGVAAVFGPGDDLPEGFDTDAFVAESGDLARFLVFLEDDALDGRAVDTVLRLQEDSSDLLQEVGLDDAELLFGGDTAISAGLVERTLRDLGRVAPVALLATFLVLALYLRSLVAPIYLVAASVLALLASLGLSAYLYEPLFGPSAFAFFVPFAASVLLLALGSDYNVFLAGQVWDEAERRPLREAVEVADARAAKPIATAGIILAASFALLALVPLTTFRAIALTMALGLLLDTFLVRQLLVPALIVLVGRRSGWPGRQLGRQPGEEDESPRADEGDDS